MPTHSDKSSKLPFGAKRKTELFKGRRVYFSGSIKGELPDPLIGFEVVKFMLENGADVPSAHVAARNPQEMLETFYLMSGEGVNEMGEDDRDAVMAYRIDMGWVDEASHVVAVIDGASHGVGMELMRALLKPQRGLNHTPVLCLVSEQNFARVSWMIKGATYEFGDTIKVVAYSSTEQAKEAVGEFLG